MYRQDIFSTRLRGQRKTTGESQEDLAAVLGISQAQVSDLEKGSKGTTFEKLYLICQHYDISADYLLGLTDDPRKLNTGKKEGDI